MDSKQGIIKKIIASIGSGASSAGNWVTKKTKTGWDYTKKGISNGKILSEKVVSDIKKAWDMRKDGPVLFEWNGKLEKTKNLENLENNGIMSTLQLKVRKTTAKLNDNAEYSDDELLAGDVRLAVDYIRIYMGLLGEEIKTGWNSNKIAAKYKKKGKGKENENEDTGKYKSLNEWCEKKKAKGMNLKLNTEDFLINKLKMSTDLAKPLSKILDEGYAFESLDLIHLLLDNKKIKEEMNKLLAEKNRCLNGEEMRHLVLAAKTCGLDKLKSVGELSGKKTKGREVYKKWEEMEKKVEEIIKVEEATKDKSNTTPSGNAGDNKSSIPSNVSEPNS